MMCPYRVIHQSLYLPMSLIGPGASDVITARDADKQCKLPPRLAEMSEIQEGIKASQAVLKDARKFFADKAAAEKLRQLSQKLPQ